MGRIVVIVDRRKHKKPIIGKLQLVFRRSLVGFINNLKLCVPTIVFY